METVTRLTVGAAGVACVVLVILGRAVARSVTGSLDMMRGTIMRIAESSDLNIRATVAGRDELTQTAQSLNTLVECVQRSLREVLASWRLGCDDRPGTDMSGRLDTLSALSEANCAAGALSATGQPACCGLQWSFRV